MTLHLIGTGLDVNTITQEAKEVIDKAKSIYLENYTVDFPYDIDELEVEIERKVIQLNRENIENEKILEEAKTEEIALLVYGDSLSATTHTQLILECKKLKIPFKIHHNASILIAISQTGLQPYKFGKTASMPKWQKNYEPTSFLNYFMENDRINAHTLILTDIGLSSTDSIYQLEKACNINGIELGKKIIILSNAGTKNQKIYYEEIPILKDIDIAHPFCIIIPSELHFIEEEALLEFKEKI